MSGVSQERAILVGLDEDLDELAELVQSAGGSVAGRVVQRRARPVAATYIGKGKAAEVRDLVWETGADLVVVDDELSPAQARNLENLVEARVVDRTQLILDIFAQRARTKEGKLQVELAQLNYQLPRLAGAGTHLSRLGGGIGTRGPGETKLETDRRRIRRRIAEVRAELEDVRRTRAIQRAGRRRAGMPVVALVGYTNAGKSTLMNALTKAGVAAEDRLFATLDPTIRRVELTPGSEVLLADTVGFVRKLPHQLVAAFRATLEEVQEADVLLHVVDAAQAGADLRIEAVKGVLDELGVLGKPMVTAFNKLDKADDPDAVRAWAAAVPRGVAISARSGAGLKQLREVLARTAGEMVAFASDGRMGR
ncbi:MAG: GTPase HflX [Firmicutes bacterium]|nr:GTPase HflX [Bacillota bacterium]